MARRDRPDLVVSDVMMPDIDGLRLVDQLRGDDELRDTPLLLLSGRAGPEATVDGLARGADDYLVEAILRRRATGARPGAARGTRSGPHRRPRPPLPGDGERRTSPGSRRPSNRRGPSRRSSTGRSHGFGPHWGPSWSRSASSSATSRCSVCIMPGPRFRFPSWPVTCGHHSTRTPTRRGPCGMGWHAGSRTLDGHAREFPDLADDLKASALEALAVLPLRLPTGVPFAALAIGWDRPAHFDTELTATLDDVAAVVAGAAQRGQLAELERSAMQRLEDNLLGIDTRATGVIVRARHQGADAGINVGGDWYDAVDIGEGRVAVAVGDVVGRGLDATTTAVRLRGALGLAAFDIRGLDGGADRARPLRGDRPGRPGHDSRPRGRGSRPGPWCPTPAQDTRPPCWCHRPVTWPTSRRAAPGRSDWM